ncbi:hypothetical protein ACHAXA_009203 [Cyclostephanos tholiformis]|uniref:Kinesin motor domain-containing protein n=1 Tax=Cyclostephanos tholiformis TaxID=382380 RepID=A0ABD3RGD3_9STRA
MATENRPSSAVESYKSSSGGGSRPASSPPSGAGGGSAIQVVVRLRPMNDNEMKHGTLPVITAKTQEGSVTVIKGKGRKQLKTTYSFDNVFTGFSTQEEVFEATVKPVIMDVMRGFESTVFAYGQTGTGKTHTMEGSLTSPELYGIIPRSARAMFEHLKQPQYKEQVVTCSYLEIYNEELRDLLVDSNGGVKMDIMEGKDGTFCRGLTEKQVHSAADVLNLMQRAQHSRMIGETRMNKSSSRSHCLFTIQVHGKISLRNEEGDMEFTGKLHMVDLAGSEVRRSSLKFPSLLDKSYSDDACCYVWGQFLALQCAKSAGNDKGCPDAVARERERMNINRSLLTLGRVITVLKEKSLNKNSTARIPYRDSKLTRVLQEALGGRCKTVIIATVSPSITAIEESVSTLNYAHSANGIVNNPVSSSLIALGDNMPSFDGNDSKSPAITIDSWQEMEMRLEYMQTQVDEAQAALARKHIQQLELQDRVERAESDLLNIQQKLFDASKEILLLKQEVDKETRKRLKTEQVLHETQIQLQKKNLVLKATQDTEISLTMEAQTLIRNLEDVIKERNDFHSLILIQRDQESERRNATKQFQSAALAVLDNIKSSFDIISSNIELSQKDALKIATINHTLGRNSVSETQKLLSEIAKNVTCVTDSIKMQLAGEGGMISTAEASSKSALNVIQSSNDEFFMGEKSLEDSCESMRRRLDECTKKLDESSSSIQASTSQALQSFESNVIETRNVISHLVMRMRNSITKLSQSKLEKAQKLDSLIEQWREKSLANSKTVLDSTTPSSASLKMLIDEFDQGMHNHDQMKKLLGEQRSFLEDTGPVCVQAIDHQTSLLNLHRQRLIESRDVQVRLQNEVMQSIISGVNVIVSSEIKKLADSHLCHFQILENDSADLSSTNNKITQSAKQVMDNMQLTNKLVSENASIVCNNDFKAKDVMKSTEAVLEEVIKSSNCLSELTSSYASISHATVSEMKQLNDQSLEVLKAVERDEKACSSSLINSVYKPTCADVKNTMQLGLNTIAFISSTVIPKVNGDLDGIATNRNVTANKMNDNLRTVGAQVSDLTGKIKSIAKMQHDAAETLSNETVSASNVHSNESVPYYLAELDSCKERLVSTMTTLVELSNRATSEGKSQSSIVEQSVEDFAHNQIQCTKPVDTAPSRSEFPINSNLSSTPVEDFLLKGFVFDGAGSSNYTVTSVVTAASTSTSSLGHSENPTHESQDDDNASRTSYASTSSHPSPRLKYRDINANSTDSNTLRQLKRPVVQVTREKNKCPSGLPSPSNHHSHKRMKR